MFHGAVEQGRAVDVDAAVVGLAFFAYRGVPVRESTVERERPFTVEEYVRWTLSLYDALAPLRARTTGAAFQKAALAEVSRFPLPFDLTGLAFFDAGQVWETADDVDTDLAKALGLGLRARTPVGFIRFDVGFPLDRREGDESYKLYFGFGNAF